MAEAGNPTPAPYPAFSQPAPAAHVLTPAEQEQCDALYEELKPQAISTARGFVLARTPVPLQEAMNAKIDADFPPPAPPAPPP
jgi:hypothetical protein